jgi:hypothetical protein
VAAGSGSSTGSGSEAVAGAGASVAAGGASVAVGPHPTTVANNVKTNKLASIRFLLCISPPKISFGFFILMVKGVFANSSIAPPPYADCSKTIND